MEGLTPAVHQLPMQQTKKRQRCALPLLSNTVPFQVKASQEFLEPVRIIRFRLCLARNGIQLAARIGQAVGLSAHLDDCLQLQRIEQVELRCRLLSHQLCQVHFRTTSSSIMMLPHPVQAPDLFVDHTIRDAARFRQRGKARDCGGQVAEIPLPCGGGQGGKAHETLARLLVEAHSFARLRTVLRQQVVQVRLNILGSLRQTR